MQPGKYPRHAKRHGLDRWTTDLDEALASAEDTLYFDAQPTNVREPVITNAIRAGKAFTSRTRSPTTWRAP